MLLFPRVDLTNIYLFTHHSGHAAKSKFKKMLLRKESKGTIFLTLEGKFKNTIRDRSIFYSLKLKSDQGLLVDLRFFYQFLRVANLYLF